MKLKYLGLEVLLIVYPALSFSGTFSCELHLLYQPTYSHVLSSNLTSFEICNSDHQIKIIERTDSDKGNTITEALFLNETIRNHNVELLHRFCDHLYINSNGFKKRTGEPCHDLHEISFPRTVPEQKHI